MQSNTLVDGWRRRTWRQRRPGALSATEEWADHFKGLSGARNLEPLIDQIGLFVPSPAGLGSAVLRPSTESTGDLGPVHDLIDDGPRDFLRHGVVPGVGDG